MLKWFSRKEKEVELSPLDFSVLRTDVHSHLIPGIDDGSTNMNETIDLIKGMQKLGFSKIITTPHVMSDFYKNSSVEILKGVSNIRDELKTQEEELTKSAHFTPRTRGPRAPLRGRASRRTRPRAATRARVRSRGTRATQPPALRWR